MGKTVFCMDIAVDGSSCRDAPFVHRTVQYYRTCGTGCQLVIAYCDEHGGDARAVQEMKAHVAEKHPVTEENR